MTVQKTMLQIAQERYTTKHYSGKTIPREQFDQLLEILRLAPSSVNSQTWKFITVSTPEAKNKIIDAILDFNRERVLKASDVIVFAVPEKITEEHLKKVLDKEIRAVVILLDYTPGRCQKRSLGKRLKRILP